MALTGNWYTNSYENWTTGKEKYKQPSSLFAMISKRIFIKATNDNYARLAAYIAAPGPRGEKKLFCWTAGCIGGDDYQENIAEVLDVQAMNTRTQKSKTYHLVVSFRPEDEAKLTLETFQAIEQKMGQALGYQEHQRHCGVHKDTANIHMHVAYNMIHPEKYTRHKAYRDFWIRNSACRELEKKYGLIVDVHPSKDKISSLNDKAATMEAYSGQQSFESYTKDHRAKIIDALSTAADWQAFHEILAGYGLIIKPRGNGLIFKDRHGKHAVKASTVDRKLSKTQLNTLFGPYQAPKNLDKFPATTKYSKSPLHRSPERGKLFFEYKSAIDERKLRLKSIKEQEDTLLAATKAKWDAKRQELKRRNIAKKNLYRLLQLTRKYEAEERAQAKLSFQKSRTAVRQDIPFTSWNGFLQHKAEQGNEIALAILRSRKHTCPQDKPIHPSSDRLHQAKHSAHYASQERALLEKKNISQQSKKRLQAVLRMEQITQNFQYHIDRKGAVVFILHDGSSIRDNGRKIQFSSQSLAAKDTALLYARKKWGKHVGLGTNIIIRKQDLRQEQSIVP